MIREKMNKSVFVGLILLLLAAMPFAVAAQTDTPSGSSRVTGTVVDDKGTPVVGAVIVVNGKASGVATDANGRWSLALSPGDVIRVSYPGAETFEQAAGPRTHIDIRLAEKQSAIDEVIVIGYGTTTRRSTVGAVDQIKAAALEERSVANIRQVLQGAAPSLVIQQRSFDPNDQSFNVNIRGVGTMNSNNPLIVVDGVISDGGAFDKINPADIENVSILKDAGTAAIYGSRAGNGVILITTKKGRLNQAPVVRVSAMAGVEDPKILYKPVEGWQNATLINLYRINGGESAPFTPAQIRDLQEHGNGPFWLEEIMQPAAQQNYNVSISGGGGNSTYMVSAGYFNQGSNYIGQGYGTERITSRANFTSEYKRWRVAGSLAYTRDNSKSSSGSMIANAYRGGTYYYARQQDPATGKWLVTDDVNDFTPMGMLMEGGFNRYQNDYINPNVSLDYRIVDGLKLRGQLGADVYREHRYTRRFEVNFYTADDLVNPRPRNTDRETEDWNKIANNLSMQAMIDFNRTFAARHNVFALLGTSNESYSSYENKVKIKFTDPNLGIKGDGSIADLDGSDVTPGSTGKNSISSVFGRAGYTYDERYYAQFDFRYDGSSKFPKDLRWGFFPSASLAWVASKEEFLSDWASRVGLLKLRATYGSLGRQTTDNYAYLTTYDIYANTYGFNNTGVGGVGFQIGNPDLQWETVTTTNLGFDATFFKGALGVTIDLFNRDTKEILVTPKRYDVFGTNPAKSNLGAMNTKGWELTLNYNLTRGEWRHDLSLNIGDSWNRVTAMPGGQEVITRPDNEYWLINREGLPYRSYYGYKTDGLYQSYAEIAASPKPIGSDPLPGDVKYVDRNGDGVITESDRMYLGHNFPRYTFGVTYSLAWKGFDLSVFLQGVLKREMMMRGELVEPLHGNVGYGKTMYANQLDFWTPTNPDARWPRLSSSSASYNWHTYGSDVGMFDGKYLRVKNLQLGYTLPEKLTARIGAQRLKVYVNAQNLFTFSNISFIDPESTEFDNNMGGSANSGRAYPMLRYYGMGIDITF
ncbi:MAG: TonB-dependent receptor [Rikenellaceae bacterium]|nr:TonB-dependent receptor [Rikenellaceae bacterium]